MDDNLFQSAKMLFQQWGLSPEEAIAAFVDWCVADPEKANSYLLKAQATTGAMPVIPIPEDERRMDAVWQFCTPEEVKQIETDIAQSPEKT